MNTVTITERELAILYTVDLLTTTQLAQQLGTSVAEVKAALKTFGITVRRNEDTTATVLPSLLIQRRNGNWVNSAGEVTNTVAVLVEN